MLSQNPSLSSVLQQIQAQKTQDHLSLDQKFQLEKKNIQAQKTALDAEKEKTLREIVDITTNARLNHALLKKALEDCEDPESNLELIKKILSMNGEILALFLNAGAFLVAYQAGHVEAFKLLITKVNYSQLGQQDDASDYALQEALCWHPSDPKAQQIMGKIAEVALINAVFGSDKPLIWLVPLLMIRPRLVNLKNPAMHQMTIAMKLANSPEWVLLKSLNMKDIEWDLKDDLGLNLFDHAFHSTNRDLCVWILEKKTVDPLPLVVAARQGNIEQMKILQATGWDLTLQTGLALKTAILYHQHEMIQYLLRQDLVYQQTRAFKGHFTVSIEAQRLGWIGKPIEECMAVIHEKISTGIGLWSSWKAERRRRDKNNASILFTVPEKPGSQKMLFSEGLFFLEKLHQSKQKFLENWKIVLACIKSEMDQHLKIPLFPGFPRFATFGYESCVEMGIFKEWVLPIAALQERILPKLPDELKAALQRKEGFLEFEYKRPVNASVSEFKAPFNFFDYTFYIYYHRLSGEKIKIGCWDLHADQIAEKAYPGIENLVDCFYHCPYDSQKAYERSQKTLRFLMVNSDSDAVKLVFGLWYQWIALLGLNGIKKDHYAPVDNKIMQQALKVRKVL
jgi:hypothetical protein